MRLICSLKTGNGGYPLPVIFLDCQPPYSSSNPAKSNLSVRQFSRMVRWIDSSKHFFVYADLAA